MFFFSPLLIPYIRNGTSNRQTKLYFDSRILCKFVIRNQNHERWNFSLSVYCKLHVMSAKPNIVPTLLLFRFSYCYAICLHVHRRMTYERKGKKKSTWTTKKKCLTISVTSSFRSLVVFYLYTLWYNDSTYFFFSYGLCCFVHTICMPPTGSGKQKSSFICMIFFGFFNVVYPRCRVFSSFFF